MFDEEMKEELREQFDAWQKRVYQLFQKWQAEGLTIDQCNERFWGKSLIDKWHSL